MMDKKFEKWLAGRPKVIQELAKKYPPAKYKIKEGAPYGISCAGSVVEIYAYRENGNVMAIVLAAYKTKKAKEHEKELGEQHGKTEQEMIKIHDANILVEIDPKWMTPFLPD